jgi:hypothetical protein
MVQNASGSLDAAKLTTIARVVGIAWGVMAEIVMNRFQVRSQQDPKVCSVLTD